MAVQNRRFWVRLYAVKRGGVHYFVYGYAVSAEGTPGTWKMSNLPVTGSIWKLSQFNCFADEAEIARIQQEAETGAISIQLENQTETLQSSRLVRRPSVIAFPNEGLSSGTPKSFSDDMAEMESHWELKKDAISARVFPSPEYAGESAREATIELCERLASETGIKFLDEDVARFGNFEVFRHLSGDFRLSDGLRCRSSKKRASDKEGWSSLVVWLDPPMRNLPNLLVGCRLFNGGTPAAPTCILDEVRPIGPDEKLQFSPKEPFSHFEVSGWSDGRLVGYRSYAIFRSFTLNAHVSGGVRRVKTKWSASLPAELQDRATSMPADVIERSTTASNAHDPWRATELASRTTAGSGLPGKVDARFFEHGPEGELESVEYLSNLILRPEVTRVVIADPFFDEIGVQSLLVRVRQAKEVLVLSSHTASTGGKVRLASECEKLRDQLPKNITFLNIESPAESTQQFHDRFLVIEMQEGKNVETEVWMLSNSLSSFAKNYPLVVARLPGEARDKAISYIGALADGKPPGKHHATKSLVWVNASPSAAPNPLPPPVKTFEGAESILALLASSQGLLEGWRVSPGAVPTVVAALKKAVTYDAAGRVALLTAIARWHYHGGPGPTDFQPEQAHYPWLEQAFRQMLAEGKSKAVQVELEILQNDTGFSESLATIWYSVGQPSFEIRRHTDPATYFLAEALWSGVPDVLVRILDDTKSAALFNWLCSEGHIEKEQQIHSLLAAKSGAVRALGVRRLIDWCRQGNESKYGEWIKEFANKLTASPLSKDDAWLALVSTETRFSNLESADPKIFEQSAKAWPTGELSTGVLAQLTATIDRAAPNRALAHVGRLAEVAPSPELKKTLHQWCIDQLLARIPLKNPVIGQEGIRVWCDPETILATAHSVWKVHGDRTGAWFSQEVLSKLKLSTALTPLLRVRNYSEWHAAMDSIGNTLSLGRAIAQTALSPERSLEFVNRVIPQIARTVLDLGPEMWKGLHLQDDPLFSIVAFIGDSADDCSEVARGAIEVLLLRDNLPSLWRLWLAIHSRKLMLIHSALVEALARNPSTGDTCYADDIDHWTQRINGACDHLDHQLSQGTPAADAQAEQIRGIVNSIRRRIADWRESFDL